MPSKGLEDVPRLRSSGQYNAALSILSDENFEKSELGSETQRQLLLERLLCSVLSQKFHAVKELAALISEQSSAWAEIDTDLFRLIYAYARFHTAIDLKGALDVFGEVYGRHLRDTKVSDFQPIHVLLLCFSSIIIHLGSAFFGTEDYECLQKLEELRLILLQNGNHNELGMVHLTEKHCLNAPDQIQHLQATIESPNFKKNPGLEVHLKVLLLNAYYNTDDRQRANELVSDLCSSVLAQHNYERQLCAQYLEVKYTETSNEVDSFLETLDATVEMQATGDLWQEIGFLRARRHLMSGLVDQYIEELFALLKQSQSCILPKTPTDLIEGDQAQDSVAPSQSAWLFWRQYMDLLTADMNAQNRRPLAVRCAQSFFEFQTECTIPELRYTLSTVPAECYEEIGDMHQVLHWRGLGAEIAKDCDDEDIRDEADCNFHLVFADDAIIMIDDPHGVKQKSWNAAKVRDLEILYEETKKQEKWKYTFRYAQALLDKELDLAVANGRPPAGEKWYANTLEALSHLGVAEQLSYRPRVLFALAHAKFDFKSYLGCIESLQEVIKISKVANNRVIETNALFTSARAWLHLYQNSPEPSQWSSGYESVTACLALCTQEQRLDWKACCHTLLATMWYAKRDADNDALQNTLYHITQVRHNWTKVMQPKFGNVKLEDLLTRYAISGRNAKTPYSIWRMAVDICVTLREHSQVWSWIEYSKARAFRESLHSCEDGLNQQITEPEMDETGFDRFMTGQSIIMVHWIILEENILLCVREDSTTYISLELNCTTSQVKEWYHGLVASNEDLSDIETADEILSELQELVRPLIDLATKKKDSIFILCPTQVIFKIPVHAIPVDGTCLLDLVPVVYTHSFAVLGRIMQQNSTSSRPDVGEFEFFGSPTGDTPAGSEVVRKIVAQCGRQEHVDDVSKDEFLKSINMASWIHFHGHVISADHPLNQALLFHHGEKLAAREIFKMDLSKRSPAVLLIGCGSGVERLDPGDEPLGLVSSLLFAGASSVIATMWPIHDRLSGAKFSEHFYGIDCDKKFKFEGCIDLARRMRDAALAIKRNPATQAPYFWAGFALYGRWNFRV
ncbi:hypothetical protein GLAREA_04348 [Glarea lozoyensis ATCC 20868]|uniref:CHAT domain-containing protein n=1 Tax=Glarea lozoyensis (strain ATCC 20868 / MF5171) TaxID=1116229 RepID=S3CM19_GLAL2|nr:uncharacterized protein GLAREA_04348 [Glarea lozoyensis ATCC 20868]EPE27557.1 hypothetical protein GLAREA_04348 [Glarea lozoyensis ATCC 20868]